MATQVNYTKPHTGTLFPSILNIPGGAVFADQINWGDNSQFDGTKFINCIRNNLTVIFHLFIHF